MKKDPRVYLAHILECLVRIEDYTHDGKESFLAKRVIQDTVPRNFKIMGEAAKRVPEQYRSEHPRIPWRLMVAFRDVLIHDYEEVDLERVWRIIEHELPSMKEAIVAILPPLEQLEQELAGDNEACPDLLMGAPKFRVSIFSQVNKSGASTRSGRARTYELRELGLPEKNKLGAGGKSNDETRNHSPNDDVGGTFMASLQRRVVMFLPLVVLGVIGFGWFVAFRAKQTLELAVISAYQETQLEIVRSVGRSIGAYVMTELAEGQALGTIEQRIFTQFVAPIHLLENGDAWICARPYRF